MEMTAAVRALGALAQNTRLSIFRTLIQAGPSGLPVSEIGASTKVSPATLSFHLKEMTHAGLTEARQEGRFIFYSANYAHMNQLITFLTENCCAKDGVACIPATKSRCTPPKSIKTKQRARVITLRSNR
jgi:ArsR family transcriptional regulator, arsenate/arsenite/antimonite-responsive transcriptional repressor